MSVSTLAKAGVMTAALLSAATGARADFKVWTPDVNPGELAIENVGDLGFDPARNKSGEQSHTAEIEYGLTSWWQPELELEFERDPGPGNSVKFSQITLENLFQFTERGEYWLDAGFFAEYGHTTAKGDPDEISFGPVLRKDFWGLSNAVNLFFEKDLGRGQVLLSWAWETRIERWQMKFGRTLVIEPGFQFYGAPGAVGTFAAWRDQDNRAGPQLFGKIFHLGPGDLQWNGGVLFGLTPAAPAITPRWQLEYEIRY
ncbi:MAG: hypothetical protein KGJ78_03050 [Alphaproteobacteria bacterium]|nr:hypothetical protein [Alphaproteobacteria bacterium]